MSLLNGSSFLFTRALAPFMHSAASVVSSAAAPKAMNAARDRQEATAYQPFSCMSSGRATVGDVEAARRYYLASASKDN